MTNTIKCLGNVSENYINTLTSIKYRKPLI